MKNTPFILGIVCLIILAIFEILNIISVIEQSWKWIQFVVLQTVILIFISYIFLTKIGRNGFNNGFPKTLFIIFSLIFIIPLFFLLGLKIMENQEKKINNIEIELEKKSLQETINWGKVQSLGIEYDLKTKLVNKKLQYILNGRFLDKKPEFSQFTIVFKDIDGFNIAEIFIYDWTNIVDDDGKVIGINKNDYFNWGEDIKSYRDINSYEILLTP